LVVDVHSHVLSYNRRFAEMWGISQDLLQTRADSVLLQAVGDLIKHPDQFMERVRQLYDRHDEESHDEVDLVDGRVFERYSAPMREPTGRYYGRVWYFRDVTARKRAEAALRLERDRAARYLDVADVILLALDLDGRITMINRKGCSVLGWSESELLGRNWIETSLPARVRDTLTEKLRDLQGGDLSRAENPVLTRSGEERWIAWRNTILRDDGRVVGTLSSGEDITERRVAEQALRDSQAQLQLISDNVLDLVSQVQLDGTFAYVSPSYEVVLGYTPRALVGTSTFALVHPDDVEYARSVFAETVTRRGTARADIRLRRADGAYIWLESVGKVVLDDKGEAVGAIVSSRDVTERRRREESERDYDRRLRLAIASADIALFAQDRDLRYTWLHNAQLGVQAEDALGKTDLEVLPRGFAERVTEIKMRALQTGERVREEVSVDMPGGRRYFDLIAEPVHSASEKPEGILGASLDTTARHQLEDQLRQAQKLETIGSLAGGIAHDFNNLLTVIIGYAELAMTELPLGLIARDDLDEVIRAGRSAESLTRQLLIFSRKSVVQLVLLRLNDIVGQLEKILRRIIGEHVQLDVRLGQSAGFVNADAGQLEQVLMNLVVNARDAMPTGGTLTIETSAVELDEFFARAHGGTAVGTFESLRVIDTGCGMPPDVQLRIFDPFFTTKGPEKGTGLGLATVHSIVQGAGGYITVSSVPGSGSTFTVYLPRATASTDAGLARAHPSATPTGTETILFVEDDESIRTLAVRGLQRYGYTVLTASNGGEALAMRDLGKVDLLVTDIVMPGISGRELAERLRTSHPVLKVVYTSGFTDDSELLRGIRSGDTPFVQKPYHVEVLARTLRRTLDGG
jgi:two-component system cell cycle sensor histidine kinase/response regulator CckA